MQFWTQAEQHWLSIITDPIGLPKLKDRPQWRHRGVETSRWRHRVISGWRWQPWQQPSTEPGLAWPSTLPQPFGPSAGRRAPLEPPRRRASGRQGRSRDGDGKHVRFASPRWIPINYINHELHRRVHITFCTSWDDIIIFFTLAGRQWKVLVGQSRLQLR